LPITINSNTASLTAQRHLARTTAQLGQVYESLSSGLRITRASVDAAGLAIADGLRADAKIAAIAIRNANDGISLVSIADGALNEISNILSRMGELAEQAANGTLSTTQRSSLDSEFVQLGSEIERISTTTEFNNIRLLSGTTSISLQVGLTSGSTSQIAFTTTQGTLASMGLAANGSSRLTYSLNATTSSGGQSAAVTALDAVRNAINSLTASRGTLGAVESRLTAAINNLQVLRENYLTAESQIRDVDVAQAAAELTRLSILQQAGAAVLAQANEQPGIALSLLSKN
jgi:flagellin